MILKQDIANYQSTSTPVPLVSKSSPHLVILYYLVFLFLAWFYEPSSVD